jgi:hypothetical protein
LKGKSRPSKINVDFVELFGPSRFLKIRFFMKFGWTYPHKIFVGLSSNLSGVLKGKSRPSKINVDFVELFGPSRFLKIRFFMDLGHLNKLF